MEPSSVGDQQLAEPGQHHHGATGPVVVHDAVEHQYRLQPSRTGRTRPGPGPPGNQGLILVAPGIDGSDLNQLADDLDRLGLPVVAGFSTHPHWDHLLWHPRFGDAPRYATPPGAHTASEARERAQRMAAESASGIPIPLELIGLVTGLPPDGGPVPGEILEHQAHTVGHAAILLADRGVLLAGDMLSDVLIPLLDPRRPDQVGAYESALDRLGEAARHVDVLVPGHGAVAKGDPDDPYHQAALTALERYLAGGARLVVPVTALSEVLVGAFRATPYAVRTVESFVDDLVGEVRPTDRAVGRAAAKLLAEHPTLALADAPLLATGQVVGAQDILTSS
jgi:glyoxylase-like metal-dependent hydrolase (beta-lactamase superfamily II)